MQASERKHIDSVNTLYSSVCKLRQKVQDLAVKVEMQADVCNWPQYLSTLALCASELSELRRILESNRFSNENPLVLTPMVLNPEPDRALGKATDERLSLFNHDTVPQYLRTKLEPKLESQCDNLRNRASLLPSEQINKYVNVTNRAAESSLKEVAILKQELAADFADRSLTKLNANTNDFLTMVSAITVGRGLTSPPRM